MSDNEPLFGVVDDLSGEFTFIPEEPESSVNNFRVPFSFINPASWPIGLRDKPTYGLREVPAPRVLPAYPSDPNAIYPYEQRAISKGGIPKGYTVKRPKGTWGDFLEAQESLKRRLRKGYVVEPDKPLVRRIDPPPDVWTLPEKPFPEAKTVVPKGTKNTWGVIRHPMSRTAAMGIAAGLPVAESLARAGIENRPLNPVGDVLLPAGAGVGASALMQSLARGAGPLSPVAKALTGVGSALAWPALAVDLVTLALQKTPVVSDIASTVTPFTLQNPRDAARTVSGMIESPMTESDMQRSRALYEAMRRGMYMQGMY